MKNREKKKRKRVYQKIKRDQNIRIRFDIRTRGLGCALGAGRGRDISEDAYEADVPRCRRPTASARRQRVCVREDVTERHEDVP